MRESEIRNLKFLWQKQLREQLIGGRLQYGTLVDTYEDESNNTFYELTQTHYRIAQNEIDFGDWTELTAEEPTTAAFEGDIGDED